MASRKKMVGAVQEKKLELKNQAPVNSMIETMTTNKMTPARSKSMFKECLPDAGCFYLKRVNYREREVLAFSEYLVRLNKMAQKRF